VTILTDLTEIEGVLKVDLLQAAGPPVLSFLQAVQKNPATIVGARIQLVGALLNAIPTLESTVVGQIATWLAGKISAATAPA
jgi:hypothetical protein